MRRAAKSSAVFVRSPEVFDGTLNELFERFVEPNLPAPMNVRRVHDLLARYVTSADPLFIVRQVTGTTRGETYRTHDGSRFRASDNAPVWWMHLATVRGELTVESFGREIESAPTHFFEVATRCPGNVSSAGWHVAHILPAKDRNVRFQQWTRQELTRRFIRNVHPCNHFLVPKAEWQRWGGDKAVIGFFASRYSERYADVWPQFLALAKARLDEIPDSPAGMRYVCGLVRSGVRRREGVAPSTRRRERGHRSGAPNDTSAHRIAREYSTTRLLFRADVIEALQLDEWFRVITPVGTFEMSKAEFYSTFPNVVASASYQERGLYHYPRVPEKALAFRRTLVDDTRT